MSANGTVIITPGASVTDTTPLTPTVLNALGAPSAQVGPKTIGSAHLVRAEVVALIGSGLAGYNFFDNPNFASNRWTLGTSATSCPLATKTYRADKWWCTPAGAAITYGRVTAGPDINSLHSAELTGATSVTTVDFGQDIPARLANALRTNIVVSFYLFNDTGASITPTVMLNKANALDDFSAVTNLYSQANASSVANQTWTRFEQAVDATSYDFSTGLQVVIRLPSGAIDTTGKKVKISQCKIEINPDGSATEFVVQREWNIDEKLSALDTADTAEATARASADTTLQTNINTEATSRAAEDTAINARIGAGWDSLHVRKTAATVVTIDAVGAIVRGTSTVARVNASAVTVTTSVSGAGGIDTGSVANGNWYYLWLIYNGTTVSAIASLSASAPTMPSGYTYKLLIGEFYYTGGAVVFFVSDGRRVWHSEQTCYLGSSTTYVQGTSSGGVVSPRAIALIINARSTTAVDLQVGIASNSSGDGFVLAAVKQITIPGGSSMTAGYAGTSVEVGLVTAGTAPYFKTGGNQAICYVVGYNRY